MMQMVRYFPLCALVPLLLRTYGAVVQDQATAGDGRLHLATAENAPPHVRILFPPARTAFHYVTLRRVRAFAEDLDGTIKEVRFFFETNLIGVVTKSPYELVSTPDQRPGNYNNPFKSLSAVAVDNAGASTKSEPVVVSFLPHISGNSFLITDENGAGLAGRYIHASPLPLKFRAQLDVSDGLGAPVDFYVGTNKVGTVANPPYTMTVPPLPDGDYVLRVGTSNRVGGYELFPDLPINAVKIITPRFKTPHLPDPSGFSLDFNGTFPQATNVIEVSKDLRIWTPISTNITTTNTFSFRDPEASALDFRFFRVKLFPLEPVLP